MSLQLAELAIHIPSTISILEKYEFNYYQKGHQTLKEACEQKGLNFCEINQEFNDIETQYITHLTMEDMDINLLIDRINGQHHNHEEEILSTIIQDIQNVKNTQNIQADQKIEIECVEKKFGYLKERLLVHCNKEDKILFPMMRKIAALKKDKALQFKTTVAEIKALVHVLEMEHLDSIALIADIKELLQNINASKNTPQNFPLLLWHFKEFELDFHVHIHIENNVLFPRIKDMNECLNN